MDFLSTSHNDLLELNNLAKDLKARIKIYSHVSQNVPKQLINQLNKFELEIEKEIELRDL